MVPDRLRAGAAALALGTGLLAGCTTTTSGPATTATEPAGGSSLGASASAAPGPVDGAVTPDGDPDDPRVYADALVTRTNEVRVEEGLHELDRSQCATDAGLARAQDLRGTEGLEHAPLEPVLEACAPATRAAENLSRATVPADDVVAAWLDSPGHRANLLSPDVTEIGVGCVPDGDALVCSQVFLGR